MAVNGSKKGSQWERDFAKYLSRWVNPDSKEVYFWRNAGSGSVFTTSKGSYGNSFSGDIKAVSKEGEFFTKVFSCELKNGYPNYSIDNHLKNNKSDELKGFWIQCVNDAILSEKNPFLIYKKKNVNPWVGIDSYIFKKLKTKLNTVYTHLYWNEIDIDSDKYNDIYLFDMNKFFELVNPIDIKKIK